MNACWPCIGLMMHERVFQHIHMPGARPHAGGVCCFRRRGEWWTRLSIDTEHMGRPVESLEVTYSERVMNCDQNFSYGADRALSMESALADSGGGARGRVCVPRRPAGAAAAGAAAGEAAAAVAAPAVGRRCPL